MGTGARARQAPPTAHGTPQPNHALEPTPNSLRSYVAAAIGHGSPRALAEKTTSINMIADHNYHFMPLGRSERREQDIERVKSAVLHSKYFFGSPLDFNDPFDCKPNFRSNRRSDALRERVGEILGRVGIFCVAEELYRTLMWSHYANGHRGVALQLSTDQVKRAIHDLGFMDKVKYHHTLPKIRPEGLDELSIIKRIVFTKSKRWSYENEVRVEWH